MNDDDMIDLYEAAEFLGLTLEAFLAIARRGAFDVLVELPYELNGRVMISDNGAPPEVWAESLPFGGRAYPLNLHGIRSLTSNGVVLKEFAYDTDFFSHSATAWVDLSDVVSVPIGLVIVRRGDIVPYKAVSQTVATPEHDAGVLDHLLVKELQASLLSANREKDRLKGALDDATKLIGRDDSYTTMRTIIRALYMELAHRDDRAILLKEVAHLTTVHADGSVWREVAMATIGRYMKGMTREARPRS